MQSEAPLAPFLIQSGAHHPNEHPQRQQGPALQRADLSLFRELGNDVLVDVCLKQIPRSVRVDPALLGIWKTKLIDRKGDGPL
jgi:hypothetical protein